MKNSKIFKIITIILLTLLTISSALLWIFKFSEKDAHDVFKDNYRSIVEIRATEGEDIGYGSGVVISGDGKIITNAHVVVYDEDNLFDKVEIRFSYEQSYREVKVLKHDTNLDLALLKLDYVETEAIELGNKYDYGNKVYAIGNGSNYGLSITEGIISNPELIIELSNKNVLAIQSNLIISEGNSGGALLDKDGNLIGITTFRLKDNSNRVIEGICYSVPIKVVKEFIK